MKKVSLVPEWRTILKRAWSIKFSAAATLASFMEVYAVLVKPDWAEPGIWAGVAGLSAAGGFVARLLAQKETPHASPQE